MLLNNTKSTIQIEDYIILLPGANLYKSGNTIDVIYSILPTWAWHQFPKASHFLIKLSKTDTFNFNSDLPTIQFETFDHVCVGGTFDHFHIGHKILLTASIMMTNKRLAIGISDGPLLKNKKYKQYLQSFDKRSKVVQNFCILQNPMIKYEIGRLLDPMGTAAYDLKLQLLLVSTETYSGFEVINSYRINHNIPPLKVKVIELVESDNKLKNILKDEKISSTTFRLIEMRRDESEGANKLML